jgi:hypothetical protein
VEFVVLGDASPKIRICVSISVVKFLALMVSFFVLFLTRVKAILVFANEDCFL